MPGKQVPVKFHVLQPFSFRGRRKLQYLVRALFEAEKKAVRSIDYIFCSDEYLLQINREFLAHDDYTDIITFNLATADEPTAGEIYISVERVKENARMFDAPFREELARVMIHGALHLCGYRDKTLAEKRQMRKKEDFYLARLPA